MKLLKEELELDKFELIEANDINHNLFGPLENVVCEVHEMRDRRLILSGTGFGLDQDGGDHEVEFEIIISSDQYRKLLAPKGTKLSR